MAFPVLPVLRENAISGKGTHEKWYRVTWLVPRLKHVATADHMLMWPEVPRRNDAVNITFLDEAAATGATPMPFMPVSPASLYKSPRTGPSVLWGDNPIGPYLRGGEVCLHDTCFKLNGTLRSLSCFLLHARCWL